MVSLAPPLPTPVPPPPIEPVATGALLEAALAYAARGWRVFPCHTPVVTPAGIACSCRNKACITIGKHPRTKNGFQDATADEAAIRRWWDMWPDANIGGLPASAGLVAFDIDSDAATTAAQALGLFAEPTLEIRTGNGTHRYFRHGALPNGASIGGIVVRSGHGYVLLPPSLHASGRRYTVLDPSEPIPLPPQALEAASKATSTAGARERVQLAVHTQRIPPGERHGALLALAGSLASSQVPIDTAVQLVLDANAARCDPPKPPAEVEDIVRYAYEKERDKAADIARHLVIAHAPRGHITPAPAPRVAPPSPFDEPLPGVLEDMVQWSLATAAHPVRLYAVAAALGAASTVCARRFTTSRQNYATLYILVVGKSGTGKEHVRRSAGRLLRASGAQHLLGANEWTSRSAVWSAVLAQPQSLAIVDEFGQFLGAASGGSDASTMKNGVLTALMELFSRVDDIAVTPNFSTLTLSDKAAKQAARKSIERPAQSVIGLTTPAEWYDSLKANRISSGLLNRWLVLEADVPRGDLADCDDRDPPPQVIEWVQAMLAPRGNLDVPGRVTEIPAPTSLTITPDALTAFRDFKRECNRRADGLEAERLGELPMRAAEQAMRMALIAALAESPSAQLVELRHATWGIAIAGYQLAQLIPAVQERLADSPIHALRNRFLAALRAVGERGFTARELARCAVFRGAGKRDKDETVLWAQEAGYAAWGDVVHTSGAGRPRYALRILTIPSTIEAA